MRIYVYVCSVCVYVQVCIYVFGIGSYSIAQAGLELTIQLSLALNSQQSTCFSLLTAGITGVNGHIRTDVQLKHFIHMLAYGRFACMPVWHYLNAGCPCRPERALGTLKLGF